MSWCIFSTVRNLISSLSGVRRIATTAQFCTSRSVAAREEEEWSHYKIIISVDLAIAGAMQAGDSTKLTNETADLPFYPWHNLFCNSCYEGHSYRNYLQKWQSLMGSDIIISNFVIFLPSLAISAILSQSCRSFAISSFHTQKGHRNSNCRDRWQGHSCIVALKFSNSI